MAITDGKDDYSDLAPNQRRKKLTQKVDELQIKVAQETATKEGLMKMKGVYESNPALGDPMSVEGIYLLRFRLVARCWMLLTQKLDSIVFCVNRLLMHL